MYTFCKRRESWKGGSDTQWDTKQLRGGLVISGTSKVSGGRHHSTFHFMLISVIKLEIFKFIIESCRRDTIQPLHVCGLWTSCTKQLKSIFTIYNKKSRLRKTKHLSTIAENMHLKDDIFGEMEQKYSNIWIFKYLCSSLYERCHQVNSGANPDDEGFQIQIQNSIWIPSHSWFSGPVKSWVPLIENDFQVPIFISEFKLNKKNLCCLDQMN